MLWDQLKEWKENCRWVELSHPLSPRTPHWSGFPDMADTTLFDYPDGFYVNKFELVSQYGTHVDAPAHFIEGAPTLESFAAEQLVMPLCVVDLCAKVRENQDYAASKQDILDWEAQYGPVPEGAFVALRTDWSKRGDLDNMDESGQKHYPGWSIECLEYLVKERKVGAIGHEPSVQSGPGAPGGSGDLLRLPAGCGRRGIYGALHCGVPQGLRTQGKRRKDR